MRYVFSADLSLPGTTYDTLSAVQSFDIFIRKLI
jgi:hypothetical protein